MLTTLHEIYHFVNFAGFISENPIDENLMEVFVRKDKAIEYNYLNLQEAYYTYFTYSEGFKEEFEKPVAEQLAKRYREELPLMQFILDEEKLEDLSEENQQIVKYFQTHTASRADREITLIHEQFSISSIEQLQTKIEWRKDALDSIQNALDTREYRENAADNQKHKYFSAFSKREIGPRFFELRIACKIYLAKDR